MTMTVEFDTANINVNQQDKYLDHRWSFISTILYVLTHKHGHAHRTDFSTWTTRMVGTSYSYYRLITSALRFLSYSLVFRYW